MGNKMIETIFLSNISIRNKTKINKGNTGLTKVDEIVDNELYFKAPPRLLGIERSGILDSRVKALARKFYVPENGHGKPNRLKIDCIAKNGKIFNDVNLQPRDVEIIDINPRIYLHDRHLGLNQLLMIIDQVNKSRGNYSIYFSQDRVEGTEEAVYDVLNRLSVYKNSYWNITLLTIRLKDLAYIVSKGPNDRVLDFISEVPNLAISISEEIKDTKFSDNLARVRPKFKVLFLLRAYDTVDFKHIIQIVNSCEANVMVCESEVVKIMRNDQKYIELVTGGTPVRPVIGLPYPLFYAIKDVEGVVNKRNGVELSCTDGEKVKLRAPTNRPTILLNNISRRAGTRIMEGKFYRTLLLDEPLDLPYVMVTRLQELLVK